MQTTFNKGDHVIIGESPSLRDVGIANKIGIIEAIYGGDVYSVILIDGGKTWVHSSHLQTIPNEVQWTSQTYAALNDLYTG